MAFPTDKPVGIAILGMNGAGKSTLAHALAKMTGFAEMDVEDYYFPEQRASRLHALEHDTVIETEHLGELPFSVPRPKPEVEALLRDAIPAEGGFILAGVTLNFGADILSRLDLAVLLETPLETRLNRIEDRERRRFGDRVLPGGDMHAQQAEFREMAAGRDPNAARASAEKLPCPMITLCGTAPVEENIAHILAYFQE